MGCGESHITSLDLQNNTALESLYCGGSRLSELDISHNSALKNINCSGNQLTSLDVSGNPSLMVLNCGANQLSSLNLTNITGLTGLSCYKNQLTSLDVSGNPSLMSLHCGANQLSSLDLSNITALTDLSCYENRLTSLDVSNSGQLERLICSENLLTSLDITNCTELMELSCSGNKLSDLNLTNNKHLRDLRCANNPLGYLNLSQNTELFRCVRPGWNCNGGILDLSGMPALSKVCVWEMPFPSEEHQYEVDISGSPNVYFTNDCGLHIHSVKLAQRYISPGSEPVRLTAKIENQGERTLWVSARATDWVGRSNDSVPMFDDGAHGDGSAGDGTWGTLLAVPEEETFCKVSITSWDSLTGTSINLPDAAQFTTAGPVRFEAFAFSGTDTVPFPGAWFSFTLKLRNEGQVEYANYARAELTSLDSMVSMILADNSFGMVAPGALRSSERPYEIYISADCPPGTEIPFKVAISVEDYIFWTDTCTLLVQDRPLGIDQAEKVPVRIFPNPATHLLTIELSDNHPATLELYSASGKCVYRNEIQEGMEEIDVSGLSRGLYFLRVQQELTIYTEKVVVR